jgi:pyrimidine-nucleoside phosphorylase
MKQPAVDFIAHKRDGGAHSSAEIHDWIQSYMREEVADYQMSAWLMATFIQGMNPQEAHALFEAMLDSGSRLDLPSVSLPKVDKHSTGGVGDKTSLILSPLLASCGVAVPMVSGRGLGHTGGTLDKLEAIPGFNVQLTNEQFEAQLAELGCAMMGQTAALAPADKRLYALRDVTATVPFIPFIAASIMSKKLAEGIDALVLDVKTGSGAFMQAESDARHLAEVLVELGEAAGCTTHALLTDMDAPLGRKIGNWLEIEESVDLLRGGGPPDTREVTLALAEEMLLLARPALNQPQARDVLTRALTDGSAYQKWLDLVRAQGGDPTVFDAYANGDTPHQCATTTLYHDKDNAYVTRIDARALGAGVVQLGGGRARASDDVDPGVGIVLHIAVGDPVERGQALATIHHQDGVAIPSILSDRAWLDCAQEPLPPTSRVRARYTKEGWS